MRTSDVLQDLARQIRRDTLRTLSAAAPAWLTFAPPGTSNHILWHAGHALWLQDRLCVELLTGHSELPQGFGELFAANCRPVRETTDWPAQQVIAELLEQQLIRLLEIIGATSEARWQETADPRRGPATVAQRVVHGLHDEAKHSGEMYLIEKLCRAGASPDRH